MQTTALKLGATQLNFKHLRYFWMVAKTGSLTAAAKQLHLAPHSISAQITELELTLGTKLLRRVGRGVELTDAARRILTYADEIFSTGEALLEALNTPLQKAATEFRIGIADSVGKSVAYRLIAPVLALAEPIRIVCREGRLATLLADLAIHRLDLIIADRSMPANLNVRGFSHLLGTSGLSFFAAKPLCEKLNGAFPDMLDHAPMLLPGEDFAIRQRLKQWLDTARLRPKIVGEFDDSALMKEFGQAGAGVFTAPTAIATHICARYGAIELGRVETIVHEVFAITTERRMRHVAVLAIEQAAKRDVFAV
jgi:LysR family transcriptional regulator, transcriptional activator of nhaA